MSPKTYRGASKMAYHKAVSELIEANKEAFLARWATLRGEISAQFDIKPSLRIRKKKPTPNALRLLAMNAPPPVLPVGPIWPSSEQEKPSNADIPPLSDAKIGEQTPPLQPQKQQIQTETPE